MIALGSYRMAERYGHPELSMSVKKQEMPAYDGRAIQGIGLRVRHLEPRRLPRARIHDQPPRCSVSPSRPTR